MGEIRYVLTFILAILILLAVRLGKYILNRQIKIVKDELKIRENGQNNLSTTLEEVNQEKIYLREKLTELSNLYTVTKSMSFSVRFDDLFKTLKDFLVDNFQFEKFIIIFFIYQNNKRLIDKVYEIDKESNKYIELTKALSDLSYEALEEKKAKFLEKENLLTIPLIMREKITSLILVKNIQKIDYDKFLILAPQIALQLERINLFDNIEKLSIMDGLTGIFLRRYFLERLKEELSRAAQYQMNLSFIMLDLDHFKKYNDNFGHLVGDVILKEIAGILKNNIREIDLLARFGGEEFCIILPETDKAGAYVVGERIRKTVESYTIKAYDESIHTTLSMGISSFPKDSHSLDDLIKAADTALYRAKQDGRNRVCLA